MTKEIDAFEGDYAKLTEGIHSYNVPPLMIHEGLELLGETHCVRGGVSLSERERCHQIKDRRIACGRYHRLHGDCRRDHLPPRSIHIFHDREVPRPQDRDPRTPPPPLSHSVAFFVAFTVLFRFSPIASVALSSTSSPSTTLFSSLS